MQSQLFTFLPLSLFYCMFSHLDPTHGVQIIWDNTVDFDSIEAQMGRGDIIRMPNSFFIYPGTKWCGAGNIADNDHDLGEFRDTDKCCRNHDKCPNVIEGFQSMYNLTNPVFYSRLSCDCDEEFHKCLKSINSRVSTQVGHIYFTALTTKCFKKAPPIKSCKKYSYLPVRKCVKYEFEDSDKENYQWFDVPNY